jgi:hypothetical protein
LYAPALASDLTTMSTREKPLYSLFAGATAGAVEAYVYVL